MGGGRARRQGAEGNQVSVEIVSEVDSQRVVVTCDCAITFPFSSPISVVQFHNFFMVSKTVMKFVKEIKISAESEEPKEGFLLSGSKES